MKMVPSFILLSCELLASAKSNRDKKTDRSVDGAARVSFEARCLFEEIQYKNMVMAT